jgi:hypothetical protein
MIFLLYPFLQKCHGRLELSAVHRDETDKVVLFLFQGTREEWQTFFFITAGLFVLGAVTFDIFAKGELLPWATPAINMHCKELEIIVSGPLDKKEKETEIPITDGAGKTVHGEQGRGDEITELNGNVVDASLGITDENSPA